MFNKSDDTLGCKIQFSSVLEIFTSSPLLPQTVLIFLFLRLHVHRPQHLQNIELGAWGIRKLTLHANKIEWEVKYQKLPLSKKCLNYLTHCRSCVWPLFFEVQGCTGQISGARGFLLVLTLCMSFLVGNNLCKNFWSLIQDLLIEFFSHGSACMIFSQHFLLCIIKWKVLIVSCKYENSVRMGRSTEDVCMYVNERENYSGPFFDSSSFSSHLHNNVNRSL